MRARLLFPALALAASACGGDGDGAPDAPDETAAETATGADAVALSSAARVWRTSSTLARCGTRALTEDFSSGRYNAHRWAITLPAGSTDVTYTRSAGSWQPALVVALADGTFVTDGEAIDAGAVGVAVTAAGRSGDRAVVRLTVRDATPVALYTTAWAAVDSDYDARITTRAAYGLRLAHDCAPPPNTGGGWSAVHAGLDQSGSRVPRAGLANATLRRALGVSVEPYGTVVAFQGSSFVRGTTSEFGGPADTGVTASETGAISGERLRSLNDPLNPSAAALAARPEDFFYAAMRFDYAPSGIAFWRNARLLVVNPANGRAIVVRPVDWGPHTRTGRLIDLSPQAMRSLGLSTDQSALVAFAAPGSALGVVR